MIGDDRQVAVAFLVGDLVDADAPQCAEGVVCWPRVGDEPVDDRPDAPPGDAHQLAHRRLRGVGDEPAHLVLEGSRVARTVACPGDEGDRRPVGGAVHPRRIGLENTAQRPEVEAAPPSPLLTLVIAGRPHPAASTAPPAGLSHAHVDDDDRLVVLTLELHVLDHDAVVDTDDPAPYVGCEQRRSPHPRSGDFRQPRS